MMKKLMFAKAIRRAVLFLLMTNAATSMAQPAGSASVNASAGTVECPKDAREESAWYVGPYKGPDSLLTGQDLALDVLCADRFKRERYPRGFVTIFGSSSIGEYFEQPKASGSTFGYVAAATEAEQRKSFNVTYAAIQTFAHDWTRKYGADYPILTGAGPGLMEAGSRGAFEAGQSIGYTTYYDKLAECNPHCYGGQPGFSKYKASETAPPQKITSDGLIFSSVSIRETAMILHSAAIVIAPGGTGTEWETYQVLEMLKSRQLTPVPIFFVGQRYHWNSFVNRIRDMEDRGTIKKNVIQIAFAQCPADLVNRLAVGLDPSLPPPPEAEIACASRSPYEVKALRALKLDAAKL